METKTHSVGYVKEDSLCIGSMLKHLNEGIQMEINEIGWSFFINTKTSLTMFH